MEVSAAQRIKPFGEREPLELPFHVSRLHQLEELWYRLSVNRHEMVVGVVLEQLGSSFEDVLVMLDQPFRTRVRLPNFAFSPIAAEEPVVAQRVCVLLLGDPDALSGLLPESLQLSRSNCHMSADLKSRHTSSWRCDPTTTFDCPDHVGLRRPVS